jgi:4-diphosphocytidyl-2-C-methyl-D-erythritol kinase
LTPLPDLPPAYVLLAFPPFLVGTAGIYAAWRPSLTSEEKPSKIRRFLENRDLGLLENRLEETIFRFHPQLEEYKRFFRSRGAAASLVSGTGSTVFGLFSEKAPALEARRLLRERVRTALVETLAAKEYAKQLRAGV